MLQAAKTVKHLKRFLHVSSVDVYGTSLFRTIVITVSGYPSDAVNWTEDYPMKRTELPYNSTKYT
jgi:hypothetical protein